MLIKNGSIKLGCFSVFILFNISLLIAENAVIIIDGSGSSITLTASGENKAYLIHNGVDNGEIIVNSGGSFTSWAPEALINFNISGGGDITVPVELSSFNITEKDGAVILVWETQTETENFGFHIFRSLKEESSYERINTNIIKGAGTSIQMHEYRFIDHNTEVGTTYYYKLASIDFCGNVTFNEPVSITLGELPSTFCLLQNYPNPFNPKTQITFSIPESGFVTLKIYDVLGKEIKTLINESKHKGTHTISFNASKLVSGVYFYKIKYGEFSQIKKMLLAQ